MSPLVSACPASLLLIGQGSPAPALRLAYLKVGCPAPLPLPLAPLPPREPPTRGLGHNLCWKLAELASSGASAPGCRLRFHNGFVLSQVCLSQGHCLACPPPLPRLVTHALRSSPPSLPEVLGCERPLLPVGQVSYHLPPGQDVVGSGGRGQGWEAPPPTLEPSRGLQLPKHTWPGVTGLQVLGWGLASVSLWGWGLPKLPTPYSWSQHRARGLDSGET